MVDIYCNLHGGGPLKYGSCEWCEKAKTQERDGLRDDVKRLGERLAEEEVRRAQAERQNKELRAEVKRIHDNHGYKNGMGPCVCKWCIDSEGMTPCPDCGGTGEIGLEDGDIGCPRCKGSGDLAKPGLGIS